MNSSPPVWRGLRAGLVAAAALIVWFLVVDVVRGLPLITPAYLSGLVFSFTTALPATARVLAFTVLLFVAYGLTGCAISVALVRLSLPPHLYYGVAIGLLISALAYFAAEAVYDVDIVRALGWVIVLGGNVVAGITMVTWLRLRR